MPPILSIVSKKNSGKTTLIEKLIPELTGRGYRVGTIKHDVHGFDIDPGAKYMLLNGLDPIALTLEHWPAIEAFHERRREARPWLYRV